ncbi:hypothetical protein [Leptodesmis sp.]|uniref:hypothetical protein n=1 Tax=Leptodesmis sp. TaxID=3100501 RepID=UPI0040534F11
MRVESGKIRVDPSAIAIAAHGIDMVLGSRSQPFQALKSVDLQVEVGTVHNPFAHLTFFPICNKSIDFDAD